jgi:hypothetical protein
MAESIFTKLGMYIVAPESISTAYFINPSHKSVYLYVYPPLVARQRLHKHFTAAKVKHPTIVELLNASFFYAVSGVSKESILLVLPRFEEGDEKGTRRMEVELGHSVTGGTNTETSLSRVGVGG